MPIPPNPPLDAGSPLASWRGHHVGLRVADLDAAIAWYTGKLDFRVLHQWEQMDLRWAYLSPPNDDNFHIELIGGPVEHPAPAFGTIFDTVGYGGYVHMCLEVASVDEAQAELTRRGVALASEVFDNPDISRRLLFVHDPWGNMIELAERLPGAAA